MPQIIAGISNAETTFNLKGLDYAKGVYTIFYSGKEVLDGEINQDVIRVGIRNKSNISEVIQVPTLVRDYQDGDETPYSDLTTLLTDLSSLLGFNRGGGSGSEGSASDAPPFISDVRGVLSSGESRTITIDGVGFLPDSVITIEDATITNVVILPDRISVTAICNNIGAHEVIVANGEALSTEWNTNFVQCINVPNGVEQRFITGFSAKSSFSATFDIANAFDGSQTVNGNQHFSAGGGQAAGHYIQIDHGVPTLITKLGLRGSTTRISDPYSFQTSDDGTNFTEALQISLPADGSLVDLEAVGVVANFTRLVWIDTVDFANAIEYFILGRQ